MVNLEKYEKIAVLRGGISDEKKISVMTANQVFKILKNKYQVTLIDVGSDCKKLIDDLLKIKPSKIFNCLHGSFGEDGQIQSILNYLKIPYTHSGVLASSIAMNKIVSKVFFKSFGVRCPTHETISQKENNFLFPAIIKPICGGSSNDLIKVINKKQLHAFIKKNNHQLNKYMIEEFIEGREITVGILDNKICGIMEIIFDSEIYDYKNKYQEIAKHVINPELSRKIIKKLETLSLKVHSEINCQCISRLDFRYNEKLNDVFLLEINTQPGLTQNSLLPEMAKNRGIDFLKLCEIILSNAKCETI